MPRIWTSPPSAMETVDELFNEDRLAHSHIHHVFYIPRLIAHLRRNQLSKDVDVLFTVNMGPSFWPCPMLEPLTVLIVLPLDHVPNYRGHWVLRGILPDLEVYNQLEAGFNILSSIDVENLMTRNSPSMECKNTKRSGVGLFCSNLLRLRTPPPHSPCPVDQS